MKKSKLLGVLGVGILSSLVAISAKAATVEYPVYGNETSDHESRIYFDNFSSYKHVCSESEFNHSSNCKEYKVTEDDGRDDLTVRLTEVDNEENTFEINKTSFTNNFVIVSEDYLDLEQGLDVESLVDDDIHIAYFKDTEEGIDTLRENLPEEMYYTFVFPYVDLVNITIRWNTTILTSSTLVENAVNNGLLITGGLYGDGLSGYGNVWLNYEEYMGSGPLDDTSIYDAYRLNVKNMSGVTIDVIGADIKEGMGLGSLYSMGGSSVDKETARSVIESYNDLLGPSLEGYRIVFKEYNFDEAEYGQSVYYYGELEKVDMVTKAKEEKNPKTLDKTMINTIMLISGMMIFVLGTRKVLKKSR